MNAEGGAPRAATQNVLLLWAAQFVSVTGDAVFLPCVAWLAGRLSPGETPVGLAVALATVPYLLFGPLAGAWVDRSDRRRVMVVSDLLRAGLLLGFAGWVAATDTLPLLGLLATAFLLGAFSTPFAPARDALLPDLLPAAALPRWNAIVQTSAQAAQIVGLLLGALLLSGATEGDAERRRLLGLIAWDGASFLLSAALLLRMAAPARAATRVEGVGFWRTARDGWRYASGDLRVRRLLVLTALDNLAIMGPAIVGATLLVQRAFGRGPGSLALFEGAMAVGMLLGSCVLALGARRWPLGQVLLWGMLLDGLTYLPFFALTDFRWALVAILLHGTCIPFLVVARTSLLHRIVPTEHRGQVFALVGVTVAGMTALSAAASGWIASLAGVRVLFLGAGILGAACGLLGFLWMGRRLSAIDAPGAPVGVTTAT